MLIVKLIFVDNRYNMSELSFDIDFHEFYLHNDDQWNMKSVAKLGLDTLVLLFGSGQATRGGPGGMLPREIF